MPELPEVETVRKGLEPAWRDKRITRVIQRRPDLRIPFPANFVTALEGRRVSATRRRAKYILVHLEGDLTLIMHLGMSGRLTIEAPSRATVRPGGFHHEVARQGSGRQENWGAHEHVIFELEDGTRIIYADHRRFGLMTLSATTGLSDHPLLRNMGIEPLGPDLTANFLSEALRNKKTPIKSALLDQRLIAGLGNIYVCEALYYAGISPRRKSYTVPGTRAARLAATIPEVLRAAIKSGGSSLRDYAHTDGAMGYFQHQFAVYDRSGQPCRTKNCTATIKRIVQSGRSTFYCPKCQR